MSVPAVADRATSPRERPLPGRVSSRQQALKTTERAPGVQRKPTMGRSGAIVLYVLIMTVVVTGVDVLFFRDRFWERLMVNVGIVLVFGAFYLRFLKQP